MTDAADLGERLEEALDPVRDVGVGALLDALAAEIEAGADVEAEPMRRDDAGQVARAGPLALPARDDLLVARGGRSWTRRIDSPEPPAVSPLSLVLGGGLTLLLGGFAWDAMAVRVETPGRDPEWQRLRLWALEWIQGGVTDVSPDLAGAVHALEGPEAVPGGWWFRVDLGSAPVAAVPALVMAAAGCGASRIRLGAAAD